MIVKNKTPELGFTNTKQVLVAHATQELITNATTMLRQCHGNQLGYY